MLCVGDERRKESNVSGRLDDFHWFYNRGGVEERKVRKVRSVSRNNRHLACISAAGL